MAKAAPGKERPREQSMTNINVHQLESGATNRTEIDNSELRDLYREYLNQRGIWAEGLHPTTIEGRIAHEVLISDLLVPFDGAAARRDKERYQRRYHSTSPADAGVPMRPVPGVLIPYQPCLDGVYRCRVRWLRREYTAEPDELADTVAGETQRAPRWDATAAPSVPWFRALPSGALDDPSVDVVIVEGPPKAVALAQYGFACIATAGADAGLHDPKRPERMNQEAGRGRWDGRRVTIMMDANQAWNPLVALGVARAAQLHRGAGAQVRICLMPPRAGGNASDPKTRDQGPDDRAADMYRAALASELGDHEAAVRITRKQIQELLDSAVPGDVVERFVTSEHPQALLDDLVVQAQLHLADAITIQRVASSLGRGTKGLVNAAIATYRDSLRKKAKEEEDERPSYYVENGAYHHQGRRVCSFTAQIQEEVQRDDGQGVTTHYRISGIHADGSALPLIEVPADEYRAMGWLCQWPSRAYTEAGRAAQEHARTAIQALSSPSRRTVYAATGWRDVCGQHVYVLPGGGIGPDGLVEVECDVEARYHRPALPVSVEEEREALRTSLSLIHLAPREVMGPLIGLLYLAPLRPLLPHGVDFVLWLHGQTGAMKSSLAGVVQSHFGEFSHTHLPGSWEDTPATMEKSAAIYADVIYTIDNLVPAKTLLDQKNMISKVGRLIQMVGDGQSRGRQTSEMQDRQRYRPRAAVLSTAETLPPSDNESTFGRTFAVPLAKGEVDVEHMTRLQSPELRGQLQKALGAYVRWIAGLDWPEKRSALRQVLEEYRTIGRRFLEGHPRLPGNVALLRIGLLSLREYGISLGVEDIEDIYQEATAGLMATGGLDQPSVENPTAVDQWLRALQAMLRSRVVCVAPSTSASLFPDCEKGRPVPCIGWRDGEEVLFDPDVSYHEVTRYLGDQWRCSQTELHRQLLDAVTVVDGHPEPVSVLARLDREGGKRRVTRKATTGDGRPRVLTVRRIVLGLVHDEGLRAVHDADDQELTDALADI